MNSDLERALRRACRAPVLLVACDFDGTLSPIVSDPAAAAPDPRILKPLHGLAALADTPVVVISGRGREDLERRLGHVPEGIDLIGSHGAEIDPGDFDRTHPDVETFIDRLRAVVQRYPGSELEAKPLSVAFHLRNVTPEWQDRALQQAKAVIGPRAAQVKAGKKVVEFMAVEADKGAALERHRAACGADAAFFVGDDVTDEAAFSALRPGDVGVKVGPGPTAARYRVADQANVAALLVVLLSHRTEHLGG